MNVIEIKNLSKCYRRYERFRFRARELVTLGLMKGHHPHYALQGLNLQIQRGEVLGVVGGNGCGKSTLLKILAGVCHPSSGEFKVQGQVAALLELGAVFNPHFTGRENALLQAAMHGLDKARCLQMLADIEAFAGLGEAWEQPLRTYSSGMVVRLAFSTAVAADPDILLVDEALAVGDAEFRGRCMARMEQLKAQGRTIILVSHNLDVINSFCTRAVLIERGQLIMDARPETVVTEYLRNAKMLSA
jgi:lipopolysaccharide transport system ATP-binding protein